LETIIYHNPRCSKSRATLALLEERGISPTIIEYIKAPPDRATLQRLLRALGCQVREIMRTKEPEYQSLGLATANDDELLRALVEHPTLLERPIVIRGEHAVIGRPPENVLKLISSIERRQ
jgi:arsenate reductase